MHLPLLSIMPLWSNQVGIFAQPRWSRIGGRSMPVTVLLIDATDPAVQAQGVPEVKRQETYLEAGYTTLSLGDIDAEQRNTVLTTCKGGAETPALACMPGASLG